MASPTASTGPSSRPSSSPSALLDDSVPYGIQYSSIALSDLYDHGCSPCYSVSYSSMTSTANITTCAGPLLFVGARLDSSTTFLLGAFSTAQRVAEQTALDVTRLSNGVYWYLHSSKSFGFSGRPDIKQAPGDIASTMGHSRLSWNLDNELGGYRAGNDTNLSGSNHWRKAIYNCPEGEILPMIISSLLVQLTDKIAAYPLITIFCFLSRRILASIFWSFHVRANSICQRTSCYKRTYLTTIILLHLF